MLSREPLGIKVTLYLIADRVCLGFDLELLIVLHDGSTLDGLLLILCLQGYQTTFAVCHLGCVLKDIPAPVDALAELGFVHG
jgi:hypothetical protein